MVSVTEELNSTEFYLNVYYFFLPALGLSCGMWDLVPCPGIEPRPPTLGSLSPCSGDLATGPAGKSLFLHFI